MEYKSSQTARSDCDEKFIFAVFVVLVSFLVIAFLVIALRDVVKYWKRILVVEQDSASERKKMWQALGVLDSRLYKLEENAKYASRVSCSRDLCGND